MKKFRILLAVFLIMICTVCFATDEDALIEIPETYDEDDISYLNDYDDFYNTYNEMGTQEEIREYYREFLSYSREQDAIAKNQETVKAKILDAKDVKTTYAMDYYTPYKLEAQTISVQILEGEYKGKIIDMQYVLTADTYGNIKIQPAKTGDIIYVVVDDNTDSGEIELYTGSHDSRVSRLGTIGLLIVAVVIAVCIFGKIKGLKTLLLIVLVFDLVFVLTIPLIMQTNSSVILEKGKDANFPTIEEIAKDESIAIISEDDNLQPIKVEVFKKSNVAIYVMIFDIIIIVGVNVINHLGLSKKALMACGITLCIVLITAMLVSGVNLLTKMNGNTFEAVSSAESIINRNVDFAAIYMFTVLVICGVAVSNVVSKVMLEYKKEYYEETTNYYMIAHISMIAIISLILLMHKVITLMVFRYTVKELLNSEMMLLEVSRMLMLILATVGAKEITECVCKKKEDK